MKFAAFVIVVVAALALVGSGCRKSPISADDYDRSCDVDDDCVLVGVGDTCNRNACAPGAINAAEQERYAADTRGICAYDLGGLLITACGGSLPSPTECEGEPFCADGICDVRIIDE